MTHFASRRNANHFFFNEKSCNSGEARRYMKSQRFKNSNKKAPKVIINKKKILKKASYNTTSSDREILQWQLIY